MYSSTWPVFRSALNIVTDATFWTAGAVYHKYIWPAEFGSWSKLKDNNSSFASFKQSQIQYNISVGRHLHQSSSPGAWPLQDWPKARACCYRHCPNSSKILTGSRRLFQCLITLSAEKCFLMSSLNFHWCSFNHSHASNPCTWERRDQHLFLNFLSPKSWDNGELTPQTPLQARWTEPSAALHRTFLSALSTTSLPFSGCIQKPSHPSWILRLRTAHRTQGEATTMFNTAGEQGIYCF